MPVQNAEIAGILEQVADVLELQDANPFRVRAYRTGAQRIRGLSRAVHELLRAGEDLAELPGIGKDLAGKIAEIATTGRLALLDELAKETPRGLLELLAVPGLGPKRVRALRAGLGVEDRRALHAAARAGRVRSVPGFGERSERALLAALAERPAGPARTPWFEAAPVARTLVAHLASLEGVHAVEVAGSFRRRRETVGDLDLLVACRRGTDVAGRLAAHEDVARVVVQGRTKTTVMLRSGLQVDLRVVPRASFGAALHYLTGSKAHNIAVRKLGVGMGLKLNEYGVFRGKERVGGRTEQEVYRCVGLA
jgi:DNA polymerase (family 10)